MSHEVTKLRKEDVDPIPARLVPMIRQFMKLASQLNVWLYEKTDGRLGGRFVIGGAPVCLVTMTGRKTGKRITKPLIHVSHGDDVLLVASQGGLDTHPLWYKNLVANPSVQINAFGNVRAMLVRQATPAEKLALWPTIRMVHKDFDEYQARTDRDIPVMICSPSEDSAAR
jgi:deazaflavin-dependent oxidoreductase (nitroreductase family)